MTYSSVLQFRYYSGGGGGGSAKYEMFPIIKEMLCSSVIYLCNKFINRFEVNVMMIYQ